MSTNKQIIQAAYQAFAEVDVPRVLGLMGDRIEWTEAEGFPLHGTYVGPQAVVEGVFMRLGEIGDEFAVTPTRFVAEDDTVVAAGTYSWKHRSTGKPAVVQMAHVWTFRDGKIIAMQQHVDTLKVQEVLRLNRRPPPLCRRREHGRSTPSRHATRSGQARWPEIGSKSPGPTTTESARRTLRPMPPARSRTSSTPASARRDPSVA